MRPLHFGACRHLFGVRDDPSTDTNRIGAVVLCYPYGQDYLYAFRPFRALATRLARRGFSVLRFDYTGTGDSAGDIEDASVQQWTSDVADAIKEMRLEGHASVSVVGFGLGATLGATAAVRYGAVANLVLWEPVIDGAEYLFELRARHRRWVERVAQELPHSRKLLTTHDLLGSRLTQTLRTDLERLSARSLKSRPARDILIIGTEERAADVELACRLRELGANAEVRRLQDQTLPSMIPGEPLGAVPSRILTQIESWLGSVANG
jgi:pimeloyl-ACP methyl ester carboxylesterase